MPGLHKKNSRARPERRYLDGKMCVAKSDDFPSVRLWILLFVFIIATLAGCSTPRLKTARANFYAGSFKQADKDLDEIPEGNKDEVLFLMERGMIRHCMQDYEPGSADWRKAGEIDKRLETYSLSRGASSLLTNDRMLPFRGMPFERTLLFSYLAMNYFALYNWDYAAISGRNIIEKLEDLNGFPDTPFSRYIAGFCMEMIDDYGNAAIQYKAASSLLTNLTINAETGHISPSITTNHALSSSDNTSASSGRNKYELVCFISIGRIPAGQVSPGRFNRLEGRAPYAEIYCNGIYLGRSYPFGNTADLLQDSKKRLAAIQLAKDVARIAAKEAISVSLQNQNKTIGIIARIFLFAFETPDTRRWETLPLWLEIARVPCPAELTCFKVVFKSPSGHTTRTKMITTPISRHGNVYISFCRDIRKQILKHHE